MRICICGCGQEVIGDGRRKTATLECRHERDRQNARRYYEKKVGGAAGVYKRRAAPVIERELAAFAPPVCDGKRITAADAEAALKWGWCPRHPDRKAKKLGLCEECLEGKR